VSTSCPQCGEAVAADDEFCEACGRSLDPGAAGAAVEPAPGAELGTQLVAPSGADDSTTTTAPIAAPARRCSCGGEIDADGWCTVCGLRASNERDHYVDQPAPHVAAVCDRGVQHPRNEDAVALGVTERTTVVVVCDGVSSASDSDVAALAAAGAARDALLAAPAGPPDLGARARHWATQFNTAARAAQDAAAAVGATARIGSVDNPPSCTFVAAVIDEPLVTSAWIGDSRAYWFGDDATATQLSVDDSWASGEIADGVAREVAEADPRAHSITRWLGIDSPGGEPSYTSLVANGPGWLLVCSDGLWNYCSDAPALGDLTREQLVAAQNDPLAAAAALVDWANAQGGHDNVTVALARVLETNPAPATPPDIAPATRST
jgi:serine/threonine protein phosphatase PrpC